MIFLILQGVLNFNVADVTLCESSPSRGDKSAFSDVFGHMKQDRPIFNLVMNETGWHLKL